MLHKNAIGHSGFRTLNPEEVQIVSGGTDDSTIGWKLVPGVLPIDFDIESLSNQSGMQTVADGFGGDGGGSGGDFGLPSSTGIDFSNPSIIQQLADLIKQLEDDHRDTLTLNEGLQNASTVSGVGGEVADGVSVFVYQDNGSTFAVQVTVDN